MRFRSTVTAEQSAWLDHGRSWTIWLPEVPWVRHVHRNHGQRGTNEPLHWRTHSYERHLQGICWWPVRRMWTGFVCGNSVLCIYTSVTVYEKTTVLFWPNSWTKPASSPSNLKHQNINGYFEILNHHCILSQAKFADVYSLQCTTCTLHVRRHLTLYT